MASPHKLAPSLEAVDIYSTQDSVVRAIKSAIFRGELKLGQRVLEEDLAAALHISRATVREALRRLEQVGLIQIKARRGIFVTRLTLLEIERSCRLRSVLEGLAARYASERLTDKDWRAISQYVSQMKAASESGELDTFLDLDRKFHELIWKLAHDSQLEHILRFLSTPYFAFIAGISTFIFSDVRKVCRAHRDYVKALRIGDPDQVQRTVQAIHESLATAVLADIRRVQQERPGQFFDIVESD